MNFLSLRPSAPTVAAISEALERARLAQAEAIRTAETAKLRRDSLLLDGQPAQLSAAEKALATAREDTERSDAVTAQLEARLAIAERTELLSEVEAVRVSASDAGTALARWNSTATPQLLAMIEEGKQMEEQAVTLNHAWRRQQQAAQERFGEDVAVERPSTAPDEAWKWQERLRKAVA